MNEVSRPIVATALVLCAVFVPRHFISGLTGQFYKQFALTIAISTVISAFNSLTLSPALCAVLLKHHVPRKTGLTRLMEKLFGLFLQPIQPRFRVGGKCIPGVDQHRAQDRHRAGRLWRAGRADRLGFNKVPTGFSDAGQTVSRRVRAIAGWLHARPHRGRDPESRDIGLKQPRRVACGAVPRLEHQRLHATANEGIVFFRLMTSTNVRARSCLPEPSRPR